MGYRVGNKAFLNHTWSLKNAQIMSGILKHVGIGESMIWNSGKMNVHRMELLTGLPVAQATGIVSSYYIYSIIRHFFFFFS